jgi:hypothetical protein
VAGNGFRKVLPRRTILLVQGRMANETHSESKSGKSFQLVLPEDSLRDDKARFMAHVVAISVVVVMFLTLASALTLMSIHYWGN